MYVLVIMYILGGSGVSNGYYERFSTQEACEERMSSEVNRLARAEFNQARPTLPLMRCVMVED